MIGWGFREHGGPDHLQDVTVPAPEAGPGEVRVRLAAAAFNHLDQFVLAGMPGIPIERPHVVGSDGAGRVDQLGSGVTDLSVGTPVLINPGLWDGTCAACLAGQECYCRKFRIVGEHTQGTATEWVVVPRRNIHPLPDGLSFVQAAAIPLVFQTAYRGLITVGQLQPGERLAVIGAGGGAATAAVQIGRWRGAKVAAVTRSPEKAEKVRALGADAALVPSENQSLDAALWEWSGKEGVDVVFDSVGAPTVPRSLRSLARGGRVVVIGGTAGTSVELDLRTLFWRQASIRGSTMATAREFDIVYRLMSEGKIRPVIDTVFPWSDRRQLWPRFLDADLFGKVVLDLSELTEHSGA